MNISRLPGLRTEDEFNREFKALSQLIGNLEEQSEAINLNKKRESENKKVDLFDVNKSISNQIQETNKELEKKLQNNLDFMEELERNIVNLRKSAGKMIVEYKRAINDLATKKTEDLVDSKLKEQLNAAKNLFFKKVLREIVVGNDKGEEVVRVLENKLAMKEKLLKKALLGSEHFRTSIEKVEAKHETMKATYTEFLRKLSGAMGFGHMKVSEELNNIEARKLFGRDFRGDRNVRESLGMKDRMLVIEGDKINFYDNIGTIEPRVSLPFADLKEVSLIKEETEMNINSLTTQDGRIGTVFFIRYKNDRGGILIEPDWACVQKWDYIFFVVNVILTNSLAASNSFRALTLDVNSSKIMKLLTVKALDQVNIKRHPTLDYDYPMEESSVLNEVDDTLIDWEILEKCSARENDILIKRTLNRSKLLNLGNLGNTKATQTDPIRFEGLEEGPGFSPIRDKSAGFSQSTRKTDRTLDLNYSVSGIPQFDEQDQIAKSRLGLTSARLRRTGGARRPAAGRRRRARFARSRARHVYGVQRFLGRRGRAGRARKPERFAASHSDQRKLRKGSEKAGSRIFDDDGPDRREEALVLKNNPLFGRITNGADLEKVVLDSLTVEKTYKQSILRNLVRGVTAKGSGMGDNSGKYVIKLSKDNVKLERYDINSKRKEAKEVMSINEVSFKFEYKDLKTNQIYGATIIMISFLDKTFWELKTPRRNKNTFYSSLIHFRLNNKDFELGF